MSLRNSRNDFRTAQRVMAATGGDETAAEAATSRPELLRQADELAAALFVDVAHKCVDTRAANDYDTVLRDEPIMNRMRLLARLLALAVMREPYYRLQEYDNYSDFGSGHPVPLIAIAQARRNIAWAICDSAANPDQSRYSTTMALLDIGRFV